MTTRVLVTGASGNVGREVVRSAVAAGLSATGAARDTDRVRETLPDRVPSVPLDFLRPATWEAALAGHDAVFLVRPPAIADVQSSLLPFVDRAYELGVQHIVFLSVAGAGSNRFVPHRKVEDHLRARGDAFTSLRPGFFAQNLQDAYRRDIVEDDRVFVPAGRKPVNWIDVRDVADVASLVLADPARHRGECYTLAGPGPIDWSEVVEALSEAVGRPIRYEPASIAGYVRHLRRRGLPGGAVVVQTLLHFLLRFGQGATEDETAARLLGRPPRSLREYVRDHADVWRAPQQSEAA